MTLVSLTLPSDGQRIDAADVNVPFNALANVLNGNLDSTNISSLTGTKISTGTIPATAFDAAALTGWFALGYQMTYTGNNGNHEYTTTIPADMTAILSTGMRVKTTRATPPPTQSTDFESTSSQYANRAAPSGIIFTDDFTCEAWIKLESYAGTQGIIGRHNGSTGWALYLEANGQVSIFGQAVGTFRTATTYQSIPLNEWVHVAGTLDMSGASGNIYINGTLAPSALNGSGTALTQAGNLNVGAYNTTNFFDGLIAEARVWPSVRTQQQIKDNMNISLTGSEGMVSLFKLSGNLNDSTSNVNHLSAVNGPNSAFADNPMRSTEYGIITKVGPYAAGVTPLTIYTGNDNNIPNLVLNTTSYSNDRIPFGFPSSKLKWRVNHVWRTANSFALGAGQVVNINGIAIYVPTGEFSVNAQGVLEVNRSAGTSGLGKVSISSTSSTFEIDSGTSTYHGSNVSNIDQLVPFTIEKSVNNTAVTPQYITISHDIGGASVAVRGDVGTFKLYAECAYF